MIRLPSRLRRLRSDVRGVSALEFALVAPMFIVMFMGMVETGQVILASRRTSHAASVLGDLIAQKQTVAAGDISDSFAAGAQMIAPMSTSALSMKVTSVTLQSSGKAVVDWSRSYNGMAADTKGAVYTPPANLLTNTGDSVIIATSNYPLTSVSHYVLANSFSFTRKSYNKPRSGSTVTCSSC